VRHRRRHRPARGLPSCWKACAVSSTGATTPPAWRSWRPRATQAHPHPGQGRQRWRPGRRRPCPGPWASPTPAGRPTASPPSATPTPTSAGTAAPWCTTASSRTTRSCAASSWPPGTASPPRPTPRSSSTPSTTSWSRPQPARGGAPRHRPLTGAYALGVIDAQDPERLVAARQGSPLVIGLGFGEHFIASDVFALLPVTQRFIFLEEGDIAELTREQVRIWDREGNPVQRPVKESGLSADAVGAGRVPPLHAQGDLRAAPGHRRHPGGAARRHPGPARGFGNAAAEPSSPSIRAVQIVACGTSYHAGWSPATGSSPWPGSPAPWRWRASTATGTTWSPRTPCSSPSPSPARPRTPWRPCAWPRSSATATTLAICNVPESSLVRESDLVLLTHAGPEIGVASTKAFTTQLVALLLLTTALGRYNGLDEAIEEQRSPCCAPCRQDRAGPGPGRPDTVPGRALRRQAAHPLPGPRRAVPHRHGGGAQAQGDLLHPRGGLSRRRAQARPPGPDRRGHAGGRRGPQQQAAGEAQVQPGGGPRPRRRALRLRRLPRPHGRGEGPHRHPRPPGPTASSTPWSSPSRCSSSPTTWRCSRAPTWTSRATWPSR
jgi:hypothetical protein